jgi:nickel-type superoxide dismutase maturation protease
MLLPAVTLKERLMLLIGCRLTIKVEGDSMMPTLHNGDIVVVEPNADASAGDIVVADHPYKRSVRLIKRVERIDDNGRYVLSGDNPEGSTDSRSYGSISKDDIRGKVTSLLKVNGDISSRRP